MMAEPAPVASGSYAPGDVTFLLKPVAMATMDLATKERLLQSGARHYSEMLGAEEPPSAQYMALYHEAMARWGARLAADVLHLAGCLHAMRPTGEVVLVSLARAGTPLGVLLKRLLEKVFGRQVAHYAISIIRDKGLDWQALRWIIARHDPQGIVFVDGWCAKGAIARELEASLAAWHGAGQPEVPTTLAVVADLCGAAHLAASDADYLIPSAILGGTVSGLVSRTILRDDLIGPDDFHGCLIQQHLAPHDVSRSFVDTITQQAMRLASQPQPQRTLRPAQLRRQAMAALMAQLAQRHGATDPRLVKPGIGEATRVLLRRLPQRLLLRDIQSVDVAHLLLLAEKRGCAVEQAPWLPCEAVTLIGRVS